MSTLNIFQISFEIWGCITGIVIAMILGVSTFREHDHNGKILWYMVLFNNIMLVCDALAYIYRGDLTKIGIIMTRISNFSLFLMEYIVLFCFINHVRCLTANEDRQTHRWQTVAVLLDGVALAGLFATPFTNLYYSFDTLNRYSRGKGLWISFAACAVVMLICIYRLYTCRKQLSKTQKNVFFSCITIFFVCMLLQFVVYGLSLINMALTISIQFMYFMHAKQQYEYRYQQNIEQAIHDTTEFVTWKLKHCSKEAVDESDEK